MLGQRGVKYVGDEEDTAAAAASRQGTLLFASLPSSESPCAHRRVTVLSNVKDLVALLDELGMEMLDMCVLAGTEQRRRGVPLLRGYYCHRVAIMEAFHEGRLFGVHLTRLPPSPAPSITPSPKARSAAPSPETSSTTSTTPDSGTPTMAADSGTSPIPDEECLRCARIPYWPFPAQSSISNLCPCFCITDGGSTCIMLWTAERARRKGLASLLVKECQVTRASSVLFNSIPFWKKVGFSADVWTPDDYVKKSSPYFD